MVVRLALGLVPPEWRSAGSRWAVVLLAAVVAVWVATLAPGPALGVAAGVAVLVAVVQLWHRVPSWTRWTAAGIGTALVAGFVVAAVVIEQAEAGRERVDEEQRHEHQVAELRPETPLAVLHILVKAIHEDDPALICFVFTDQARREFAAEANASTCDEAIHELHSQITGKGYGNSTTTEVTYGDPATVSGCAMYVTTGILERAVPPGPRLGHMRLERDPRYPSGGYQITAYEPCRSTSVPTR